MKVDVLNYAEYLENKSFYDENIKEIFSSNSITFDEDIFNKNIFDEDIFGDSIFEKNNKLLILLGRNEEDKIVTFLYAVPRVYRAPFSFYDIIYNECCWNIKQIITHKDYQRKGYAKELFFKTIENLILMKVIGIVFEVPDKEQLQFFYKTINPFVMGNVVREGTQMWRLNFSKELIESIKNPD